MDQQVRNRLHSPWVQFLVAILVAPVTAPGIFWITLFAVGALAEGWHPAWFGDNSNAQIIALAPGKSPEGFSVELIPASTAANYTGAHPGSTFLIPIDRKQQVQEQLKADQKVSWTTLEIKQLADGQQEISLEFMDRTDDSYGSRYKASKDGVQLQSYRYAADRGGMGIVLLAMVVAFAIHVLVLGFLLVRAVYVWRKGRTSSVVTVHT